MMGQRSNTAAAFTRIVGTVVLLLGGLATAPGAAVAQDDFAFRGNWVGEFEDKSEPEVDLANRGGASFGGASGGGRDRAINGRGRMECDGELRLSFRGPNEALTGRGELEQTCKAARAGTWKIPRETIALSTFEYKDKGEGKDKELRFQFEMRSRTGPSSTASNELIRCEARGKFKPKDRVFEGSYSCRHEARQRQSGQRDMATRISGKFKVARESSGGGL